MYLKKVIFIVKPFSLNLEQMYLKKVTFFVKPLPFSLNILFVLFYYSVICCACLVSSFYLFILLSFVKKI